MANEHSQIVPSMQPTSTVADFKFWCQKVLPLVYDDSLSYYEVLNKMVVYLNQVIDNINADTANVAELEDDFLLLQTYVNNFFDDIDQLVTYTERAESAETAALSSAANAAESATNAASSAVNAATSSGSAATSALSAMDAKDAAVAAKTAAETALATAQTAATNAAASATSASGSATNAAASATAAQQSFTLADAARTAAQSAATSAESDAEDAADSAAEAVAAVETIVNGLGNISKTIENINVAYFNDALNALAKSVVIEADTIQTGTGTPTITNVRPFKVLTEANVTGAGKNLYDANAVTDNYYLSNTTGLPEAQNGYVVSDYIPVIKNQGVIIPASGTARRWFYDKNKNPVTYLNNSGNQLFTPPDDGFIRVSISKTSDFYNTYIIAYGDNAPSSGLPTEYEAYNGTIYPISIPTEAGFIGGRIDVTNGKLIFDTVNYVVPVNTLNISGNESPYFAYSACFRNDFGYNSNALVSNALKGCNCLSRKAYTDIANSVQGYMIENAGYLYICWDTFNTDVGATTAAVRQYFTEHPLVFAIKTNNPQTYDITPTQIAILLGTNNIYADTGIINKVEYYTNAENYITTQIDLAKALIAPVLKEMKADTALVANDFRIVGNTLYRITGNIASGGTLTPNTNCVETTVGAILKSLLSA